MTRDLRFVRALAASSLPSLALIYFALFGALGIESPFFPSFMIKHGLGPRGIGVVLTIGTLVRIVSGPITGFVADRVGVRRVLGIAAVAAGMIILCYLYAQAAVAFAIVAALHSLALAPLNPLCDALAVEACKRDGLYPYGLIRGIGSCGYVFATLAGGWVVVRYGLPGTLVVASAMFLAMVPPLFATPPLAGAIDPVSWRDGIGLLRRPYFVRLLLVSALVVGSHVLSNTFAVILWIGRGLAPTTVSALWAEGIVSEIVVFAVLGPNLLARLGTSHCAMLAAAAGILRWGIVASTTDPAALVVAQALQGLTFALIYMASVAAIGDHVPSRLAASAQSVYSALALGAGGAVVTLASGDLYARFEARAFWAMSALCLLALPLAYALKEEDRGGSIGSAPDGRLLDRG